MNNNDIFIYWALLEGELQIAKKKKHRWKTYK